MERGRAGAAVQRGMTIPAGWHYLYGREVLASQTSWPE